MSVETIEDLLTCFRGGTPPVPDDPVIEDLQPWRERIDVLDRAILQMLNQRAVCANMIGQMKRVLGIPVYVPSREDEVLANAMTANQGPLDDDAVRRLFERIIDETRSLERHMYEEEQRKGERGPDA